MHINKVHNNIKLNPTYEEHSSINFLDLLIRRQYKKLEIDIQKTNHHRYNNQLFF